MHAYVHTYIRKYVCTYVRMLVNIHMNTAAHHTYARMYAVPFKSLGGFSAVAVCKGREEGIKENAITEYNLRTYVCTHYYLRVNIHTG